MNENSKVTYKAKGYQRTVELNIDIFTSDEEIKTLIINQYECDATISDITIIFVDGGDLSL